MMRTGVALLPLAAATLLLGVAIYHWVEGLSWSSAFLNAAMLLGGMGPVDPLRTEAGKWLAGLYALFAGVVFLVVPRPAHLYGFTCFFYCFGVAFTESASTRIRNASRRFCAMAPSELPDASGCVSPRVSSSIRLDATPCATR